MALEQFANEAITSVGAGGITSSATSLGVASSSNFPSSGSFRIRVDNEYMQVTAVSGTTWTVVRGDGGTTAAAHAAGATIYAVVTKEALESILTIANSGTDIAQRRRLNFIGATIADNPSNSRVDITLGGGVPWEDAVTTPSLSSFSWVNQGTATGTQTSKSAIFLSAPAISGNNLRMLVVPKPGTSWTAITRLSHIIVNASYNQTGFCVQDSTSGKVQVFTRNQNNYCIQNYNSPTSWSSTPLTQGQEAGSRDEWWKFTSDGTTLTWYVSPDGESWVKLTSTSATGWTAAPDHIGIVAESNNSTYAVGILLSSWVTSSP